MSLPTFSAPMIEALRSHDEGRVYGPPATLRALHRRGLCERPAVILSQGMTRIAGATLTESGTATVNALPEQGDWIVLDMDDGLLRREPTRKAALAWWMSKNETDHVVKRHSYGPGAYKYVTALKGDRDKSCGGVFIERVDVARREGWDVDQAPLYPKADEPFARVERVKPCITCGEPADGNGERCEQHMNEHSCRDCAAEPGPDEIKRNDGYCDVCMDTAATRDTADHSTAQ